MGRPGMLSSEPWSEYQGSNTRMLLRSRSNDLLSTLPKGIGLCLFTPSQGMGTQAGFDKVQGLARTPQRCLVVGYPGPKKEHSPALIPREN